MKRVIGQLIGFLRGLILTSSRISPPRTVNSSQNHIMRNKRETGMSRLFMDVYCALPPEKKLSDFPPYYRPLEILCLNRPFSADFAAFQPGTARDSQGQPGPARAS